MLLIPQLHSRFVATGSDPGLATGKKCGRPFSAMKRFSGGTHDRELRRAAPARDAILTPIATKFMHHNRLMMCDAGELLLRRITHTSPSKSI
jgi:hypothetical protein